MTPHERLHVSIEMAMEDAHGASMRNRPAEVDETVVMHDCLLRALGELRLAMLGDPALEAEAHGMHLETALRAAIYGVRRLHAAARDRAAAPKGMH
jgi:hypothetical protein